MPRIKPITFTREDVVALIENNDELVDQLKLQGLGVADLADAFINAHGKYADQACGAAIMEALGQNLDFWLREAGYA